MGKLSKGGSPKSDHILYKLTDPANGTGIDAVWRANPANNNGKKFAIVEAKASRKEDGPKFLSNPRNTRSPSVVATLGVGGISSIDALLEPLNTSSETSMPQHSQSPITSSGKRNKGAPGSASASSNPSIRPKEVLVQMSAEWILRNLDKAVGVINKNSVLGSYSRHLFYAPIYHPSGSPKQHALAKFSAVLENHDDHKAFHYDEHAIKTAVNKKKNSLSKKYGKLTSLATEF
jgi:hypothetical protein